MINPKLPLLIRHDTNVEEHTTERHVASIHDDLPSRWFVPFMHWKNKPRKPPVGTPLPMLTAATTPNYALTRENQAREKRNNNPPQTSNACERPYIHAQASVEYTISISMGYGFSMGSGICHWRRLGSRGSSLLCTTRYPSVGLLGREPWLW